MGIWVVNLDLATIRRGTEGKLRGSSRWREKLGANTGQPKFLPRA